MSKTMNSIPKTKKAHGKAFPSAPDGVHAALVRHQFDLGDVFLGEQFGKHNNDQTNEGGHQYDDQQRQI